MTLIWLRLSRLPPRKNARAIVISPISRRLSMPIPSSTIPNSPPCVIRLTGSFPGILCSSMGWVRMKCRQPMPMWASRSCGSSTKMPQPSRRLWIYQSIIQAGWFVAFMSRSWIILPSKGSWSLIGSYHLKTLALSSIALPKKSVFPVNCPT